MGVGRYVDSQDGYREALVKNMPSETVGGPWAGIDKIEFIGGVLVILFSVVVFPLVSMLIAKAAR